MPRTEGLKPIGDSIRKIIDKVIEERKKRKRHMIFLQITI